MKRLDEVSYSELTPLGQVLKRHLGKNRYIHFTQEIKGKAQRSPTNAIKIGINPKKHHLDPPGVYFYPVDWLWGHEDFHDNQQYATNRSDWVICELDLSSPGLDLGTINEDEIRDLGRKNGWLIDYDGYNPPFEFRAGPAEKLWAILKSLNQRKTMSWLRSLRGLHWIKDTKGIILSGEPEQVCAIDPRVIKVIESGRQPMINSRDWEKFDYWKHFITQLFSELVAQEGGEVIWKNKLPKWVISDQDWSLTVEWRDGFANSGLSLNWRYGRAHDSAHIGARFCRDETPAAIKAKIVERLRDLQAKTGPDIEFTPKLSTEEFESLIESIMLDAPQPEYDVWNAQKFVSADITKTAGSPPVKTVIRIGSEENKAWINCDLTLNGNRIMVMNRASVENFSSEFWKHFDYYAKEIEGFAPTGTGSRRFEENEWQPFLGWLFVRTGLKVFEPYEDIYYNFRDPKELYGQINWIFSRTVW